MLAKPPVRTATTKTLQLEHVLSAMMLVYSAPEPALPAVPLAALSTTMLGATLAQAAILCATAAPTQAIPSARPVLPPNTQSTTPTPVSLPARTTLPTSTSMSPLLLVNSATGPVRPAEEVRTTTASSAPPATKK